MSGIFAKSPLSRTHLVRVLVLLAILLAVIIVVGCVMGPQPVRFSMVLQPPGPGNPDRDIFFGYRLPRVLLGVVVGAALATSGAALQAILRNPLADPHILGISGGAALGGIAALTVLPRTTAFSISAVPLLSFVGAMVSMGLVYRIASRRGILNPYVLILAGVVVNAFCSALILLVNTLVDVYQGRAILFWLIGNLSTQNYWLIGGMAIYCIAGMIIIYTQGRDYNLLALGEETAFHLGSRVPRTRLVTFVATSLLIGGVISSCGLIGFVGLIVPHILRLLVGPDHRLLLPACTLAGASFLVAADTLGRLILPATQIPVGVVTTLLGGPFFVLLLIRSAHRELAP